jgi:3-oxoacyl-[acyl-carrier protein] reductase
MIFREFDMLIQGKTVVITGGGRGIGRDMAKAFAARGANLALFDLNQADLDETARQCVALGVKARGYVVNVTQEAAVVAGMDGVLADFGSVDVLVNNAGIVKDGLLIKVKDGVVTGKMTLEQWQAVIDINLTGVFLCGREAAERMVKGGQGGVIINISSVSRYGNPGQSNYTATKAGVAAMAEVWAKELARYGIRTGAIAPGFVRTDILSSMRPEILDKITAQVPLRRLGETSEISLAALFIVENDFVTGRCIDVDGGVRL